MFDAALDRIQALGQAALAIVPGLLLGVVVFALGLLVVRGIRAGVSRAATLRKPSEGSVAVLGRIEAVKRVLTEAGIDRPFHTSQVLWHDQTEFTDGDRARQRDGWPSRPNRNSQARWQSSEAASETRLSGQIR